MKLTENNKLEILRLHKKGVASREIATTVLGKKSRKSTVNYFLQAVRDQKKEGAKKIVVEPTQKKFRDDGYDNSCVLLISDLHIPFQHKNAFSFLHYLKKKYKPTRVICLGDELDKNGMNFHGIDPDMPSAGDEIKLALPLVKQLHDMFPVMDLLESNHGSMVYRKAKASGIPKWYIKEYKDVLGVNDGWKWWFDMTISLPNGKDCYLHHGKTSDIIKLSQQMGQCAVQGHYHESFKIDYWGNSTGLYWGMQTGCLVDDAALAFSYNNVNIKRPVVGTGLIINGEPLLVPLNMDSNGEWIKPTDYYEVMNESN